MRWYFVSLVSLWLLVGSVLSAYALTGVASKVTQVSNGVTVTLTGRHAPGSEIVVVDSFSEVVAAALDDNTGRFTFTFKVAPSEVNSLKVFATDLANQTSEVGFISNTEVLLPPSITQNPNIPTNQNRVGIGGYSYPGSTITIFIYSSQGLLVDTLVETADADGAWITEINQLGPGVYTAIAQSLVSGLQSQASIELEITVEPDNIIIEALPQPVTKAVDSVGNVVENVAKNVLPAPVKEAVEVVAPQAKQVANTVTPVASASLLTQLLFASRDLLYFLFQAGASLLQYFGFMRKRQSWGIVYDALTKQPIMLATVRLYSLPQAAGGVKKLVETDVSSKAGVFSFEPQPGNYEIRASKPGYLFPSKIIVGANDGEYTHVYHGERVHLQQQLDTIDVSIPLDPEGIKSLSLRTKIVLFVRQRLYLFTLGMLAIGFLMSLISVIGGERGINVLIMLFYLGVLVAQWFIYLRRKRSWGAVVNFNGDAMSGVQLNLIDPQFNKLVQRRVTNQDGKYQFVVPQGKYVIQVETAGLSLVMGGKKAYQGQEIWVEGEKPKLIALKIIVNQSS